MLVEAAEQAGMKVPADPDNYDAEEYPHFDLYCLLQLCRPIRWGEHWENAKVLAGIPIDELKKLTLAQLIEEKGFEYHM
jgi:hypothetical protein